MGASASGAPRLAIANGDATEVQLQGGAHVVREATATSEETRFDGEFLVRLDLSSCLAFAGDANARHDPSARRRHRIRPP